MKLLLTLRNTYDRAVFQAMHRPRLPTEPGAFSLHSHGQTSPVQNTSVFSFPGFFLNLSGKSDNICKFHRKMFAHSVARLLTLDKFPKKHYSSRDGLNGISMPVDRLK